MHIHLPILQVDEIHVGTIIYPDSNGHHVILLPGDSDKAPWPEQMAWAASIGGDLPNRVEQVMLFEKHRGQFKEEWYWSNNEFEGFENDTSHAWYQRFNMGDQVFNGKGLSLRARAVKRIPI